MSQGTLWGDKINARIIMPGGDWINVGPDGFGRPDVRVQLETDNGAIILLSYTGLVETKNTFKEAAAADRETQWADQYMRMVMHFETGAPEYLWSTRYIFLAKGRIINKHEIEYRIFKVT